MIKRRTCQLELPSGALTLGQRTLLMGVLNVTPDSFSDGGKFLDAQRAIGRALEMERAGADLLDIGGGLARPGSPGTGPQKRGAAILPAVGGLCGALKNTTSPGTRPPHGAEAALHAGGQQIK